MACGGSSLALIYPVPIKPATKINGWNGWPEDVVETLRHWNRGHRGLTFSRAGNVFKCTDCAAFCEVHIHGGAVLNGDPLCDDCLIGRARAVTSS